MRAPLSSGLLWIAIVWVLWGDRIPPPAEAKGIVAQTYTLLGALGGPAAVAGLTFTAYVVGVIVGHIWATLVGVARRSGIGQQTVSTSTLIRTASYVRSQLKSLELSMDELQDVLGYRPDISNRRRDVIRRIADRDDNGSIVLALANAILGDTAATATRLHASSKDLYDTYDRIDAEANFRSAIAIPIGLCVGSIGLRLNDWNWLASAPFLLAGILVGGLLFLSAGAKRRESTDAVMQPVFVGMVTPQAIENARSAA